MRLETCRRGLHMTRTEMRIEMDKHGNKHRDEWVVCRFCGHAGVEPRAAR